MARVNLGFNLENEDFARALEIGKIVQSKDTNYLVRRSGKSEKTVRTKLKRPEDMTVEELRFYCEELKIPCDKILALIVGDKNAKNYIKRVSDHAILTSSI